MSRQILFVIDDLELKYFEFNDLVTNFWLIKEFLSREFQVFITTKNRLMIESAEAFFTGFKSYTKNNDIFYDKQEIKMPVNNVDVVFFRPDPPVDIDYINACYVFDFVDREKTLLINDPSKIKDFNEKFHINYFPEFIPENIVTASKNQIIEFIEKNDEVILKPLNRCFGSGVYYLNKAEKNKISIINSSTNDGKTAVMVQKFVKSTSKGDKRVLIFNDKVYDKCLRKLPGEDDFKFNTHSDKFFAASKLTDSEKQMAKKVSEHLSKIGLYMVGLDVIDEKIIEINVTSPCYFIREINSLYQVRFEDEILNDLINFINRKTIQSNRTCNICLN